ncbi:hypothetical protein JRO89_XS03G0019000 [Xanthoceras sorbifolium]|uniref:FAR1 domain-containing protein n=1 Tax=Xanthoceras sorbifolium TaxID=99658 RepID=A0ABQ8I941_9ROSI|nr:hypothetical protein JRO89_XS03G0019000 [Xanthoceras sorbifolium]
MMASTSGQEFTSNRNYRQWLAETFDGHETGDDELSDNLDGNNSFIQPSNGIFPLTSEFTEPYIGMEFASAEDARECYEMYGRRMGFTIRNNRTRRSLKDNSVIGREYVCSKEGFRADKCTGRESRVFPARPATRKGCNAMLRIATKDGGKWVIYGFVKDHNHELNPSKIPPRRSHRIAFSELCSDKASILFVKRFYNILQKSVFSTIMQDEKDLKIRELSTELHREKKKSAAYQEQLGTVLKYIEEHTQRLSLKVQVVSNIMSELESEEQDSSYSD